MKRCRLLLVYAVPLAWLALLSDVQAQQLPPVRIALAGTMVRIPGVDQRLAAWANKAVRRLAGLIQLHA